MKYSKEQREAISAFSTAITMVMSDLVSRHNDAIRAAGLRIAELEFEVRIVSLEENAPPAQNDMDFLRGLRIAPDLTIKEDGR